MRDANCNPDGRSFRPLDSVNRATAILSATEATLRIGMECLLVVDRNLFAGMNVAQREEQNVSVERPHVSIWLAAVVDVMRAVAAATAVYAKAPIDVADAQVSPLARALSCLEIIDSLAGIFRDLPSALEGKRGKAALAVDL